PAAGAAGAGAGAGFGAKGPAEPLVGLLPPGVIGACAPTGAAIASAAAIATPVKRWFMLVVLCGSSGFDTTATAFVSAGGPGELPVETTRLLFRSEEHATLRSACPIPTAPDIMFREHHVSSTWGAADVRN